MVSGARRAQRQDTLAKSRGQGQEAGDRRSRESAGKVAASPTASVPSEGAIVQTKSSSSSLESKVSVLTGQAGPVQSKLRPRYRGDNQAGGGRQTQNPTRRPGSDTARGNGRLARLHPLASIHCDSSPKSKSRKRGFDGPNLGSMPSLARGGQATSIYNPVKTVPSG